MTPCQDAELLSVLQRSNKCLSEDRLWICSDFVQRAVFRDAAIFQDCQRSAKAAYLDRIVRL